MRVSRLGMYRLLSRGCGQTSTARLRIGTRLAARPLSTRGGESPGQGEGYRGSSFNTASVALAGVIGGLAAGYYFASAPAGDASAQVFPLSSTTPLSSVAPPQYCTEDELATAIAAIREVLSADGVSDRDVDIEFHRQNGFSTHPPKPDERPRYVIYPRSTAQTAQVMRILHRYRVPVVPFSGGTSLEGHFYATRPQSVVVDTLRMDKVLAVHTADLDAVVEAGVNWQHLNEQLDPFGLVMGCDCGPQARLSGMVATNALGVNATRYGAMIHNVVLLTVVLADGTVIKTKQRPRKTLAGYNLNHLFIGLEGTLGIVTECTVKLHVKPRSETVVVAQFASILDLTNAVTQLFHNGVQPHAIELLDRHLMHCINYSGYTLQPWLEVPTIFFKIGGINDVVVAEQVKAVREVAMAHNCQGFEFARDRQEQEELFLARKNIFYLILEYGRNEIDEHVGLWVTDIAVPLLRLLPVLNKVEGLIKRLGLEYIIVGHVGDGNFHADIFYKPDEKAKCEQVVNEMMAVGLANEGTASGEHGIGNGKRHFLEMEVGTGLVDLMRKIKMAMDPQRLLNPDKVFKVDPNDDSEY